MPVDALHLSRTPSVKQGMLIRRPLNETFEAFVDPAITTKFWFSRSNGRVRPGVALQWEWEALGLLVDVSVKDVDRDSRILLEWGVGDGPTTEVEFHFLPWRDGTYVLVTETGFTGSGDEIVAYVADAMGGFSMVLCALKALLEHDVVLTTVLDHLPQGLEALDCAREGASDVRNVAP